MEPNIQLNQITNDKKKSMSLKNRKKKNNT
jgi:hypothetical protein